MPRDDNEPLWGVVDVQPVVKIPSATAEGISVIR